MVGGVGRAAGWVVDFCFVVFGCGSLLVLCKQDHT